MLGIKAKLKHDRFTFDKSEEVKIIGYGCSTNPVSGAYDSTILVVRLDGSLGELDVNDVIVDYESI